MYGIVALISSQVSFSVLQELIYKGFLIGLFSSMPVGPIAILCIQRTLNKGRWHGFFTGLGAAFSDFIYALMAGFGLSFVSNFIHQNQMIIQIVGSGVILVFGIVIFRSNPVKQLTPAKAKSQSYVQDFVTSFLVTVTNPMIIFLFIGLYARFSFISSEFSVVENATGILSIFLGAITWWFMLVSFVNLFRNAINVRNLWMVNKVTGAIIVVLAIVGFVLSLGGHSLG